MIQLELSLAECQQLLAILAGTRDFTWSQTNPLLMKIGEQMRLQMQPQAPDRPQTAHPGNGPG
jgi:hypothetical protein